jgi:DNA-binding CsgD family transcriptional regulator
MLYLRHELLKEQQARYGACTLLSVSLRELDCMTIWRHQDSGPMPPDSLRRISLLIPHIQQALKIYRALTLPRSTGKPPLQLLASPIPLDNRLKTNADLLLLVTDPEKTLHFPDDILHALYNFTPAESEIANGLLMGYTPEEISMLRHVSIGTVRQQIKSMLNKTGAPRQSEMLRLFITLPAPTHNPPRTNP